MTDEKTEWQRISVRFPVEIYEALKVHYRQTYPEHALSLNSWIVDAVQRRINESPKQR